MRLQGLGAPDRSGRARGRVGRPWSIVLPITFAIGAEGSILHLILEPRLLGSHAWIYTDAARTLVNGGDPWRVGPPLVVFAGPPPMLLPFLPFVPFPDQLIAAAWVVGSFVGLIWLFRKLDLPGYWLGFNACFGAVALGHLELVAVIVLLFAGRLGGLAAIVKPYMGFALLAQRRWGAIAVAAIAFVVTAPFLPWGLFLEERGLIVGNLVRQYAGDSVYGNIPLMLIAVVTLASLGWRRALWLGAPVLWPYAQHGYKLMALPVMTPIIATFWALSVPGSALLGIVAQAALERIDHRRPLPAWLRAGIEPLTEMGASVWPERRRPASVAGNAVPRPSAAGA